MSASGRRRFLSALAWGSLAGGTSSAAEPSTVEPRMPVRRLSVGPSQQYATLRAAIRAARAGDTIEVDAGDYPGDVAVLERDFVRIVGIGGRPRLVAAGADAERKGILVVRANGVEIENIEFVGARVADHYGSGIRLDKGSLRLSRCRFVDNELGLMTANDRTILLEIVNCEFSGLVDGAGRGGALSHSLYAGAIDSLRVEGSYFHNGSRGHLIKSRARSNVIRYNRITDEDGLSSYELEFPDGGLAEVVGNLIQQGKRSENGTIVSYGAEGLRWPDNRLDVLFNTFVNDLPAGGYFVSVLRPPVETRVRHNVLAGRGELRLGPGADSRSNFHAKLSDFANPASMDFRPRLRTPWVAASSGVDHDFPMHLLPRAQYKHPAAVEELPRSRVGLLNPGAYQTLAE